MSRKIIYLSNDNEICLQLQADGTAVDLSSVTRMTLELDSKTLDSATLGGNGDGNAFYWAPGIPATGVANLTLTLGTAAEAAEITPGNHNARLTIYDPDHPAGLVWLGSEPFTII